MKPTVDRGINPKAGWKSYLVFKLENSDFITEFGITYPNGPDAGSKISIDYGVSGLPVTFFTNREGRIISRWVGAISEGLLIAHIEEILQ